MAVRRCTVDGGRTTIQATGSGGVLLTVSYRPSGGTAVLDLSGRRWTGGRAAGTPLVVEVEDGRMFGTGRFVAPSGRARAREARFELTCAG